MVAFRRPSAATFAALSILQHDRATSCCGYPESARASQRIGFSEDANISGKTVQGY
jgi:hypothetical protein